jgi:flagellin-like protein
MKMLKSKKALSPVVASIILIAVTVAVSIAVAAWMGALTFTFTSTEQLQITDIEFVDATTNYINATVLNTGNSPVTISQAWVNGVQVDIANSDKTIEANSELELKLTGTAADWENGKTYEVKLMSSKGNTFLRTETAPSS